MTRIIPILFLFLSLPSRSDALIPLDEIYNESLVHAYVLENGDNALLARVHLIRSAKTSINIQTFVWANDDSGRFVFSELLLAAKRGIEVRILIDDRSLRNSADYVAYLASAHPNIQIKQFNPIAERINASILDLIGSYSINLGQTNHRMHNKTIIVDNRYGISGGRNYADDYFDRGIHRSFKDRDLLVVGKVVDEMTRSFEMYWDFKLSIFSKDMLDIGRVLASGNIEIPEGVKKYTVPETFRELQRCSDELSCMHERIFSRGFRISEIEFIADAPNKIIVGDDAALTTQSIINLLQKSEHSVILQTPYLVVGRLGTKLLKSKVKDKPSLEFIVSTNSLGAADHFYAYAFSYKNKKKYLKKFNWQIFEMKAAPEDAKKMVPDVLGYARAEDHYVCIHAKTFVFDYEAVWLGSFNLDPRSASLNTEAGFLIRDKNLAQSLANTIKAEAAPRNSWTVGIRKKFPLLGYLNGLFENIFSVLPFLNVWPFTYSTSFELKPNGVEVPFFHEDFYENYRNKGQFPGERASLKALKTRLTKAFFGPAQPII